MIVYHAALVSSLVRVLQQQLVPPAILEHTPGDWLLIALFVKRDVLPLHVQATAVTVEKVLLRQHQRAALVKHASLGPTHQG